MADPLSIAGLLLQAIEIAGKVYDFAKQVKDAKSEIRELFGELFALKAVFEQMRIERIADSSLKSDTSPSPFRDALLKANTVLEEILEDLMSRSLRQSRLSRLGWPGRKASLQGSIAQLERLKTYFILVIMNDKTYVSPTLRLTGLTIQYLGLRIRTWRMQLTRSPTGANK